jgi:hypothetical protein
MPNLFSVLLDRHRLRSFGTALFFVGAAATALFVTGSSAEPVAALRAGGVAQRLSAACGEAPVALASESAESEETVAVDTTKSATSPPVRAAYRRAALAVVMRAASEKALLRLVAFGASGVGVRVMFQGSFAPASVDDVFNLAAANRTRCLANRAVDSMLAIRPSPGLGSDVAGLLASEISTGRALIAPGGSVTVTVFTDGCQAPAKQGPNSRLTDLCGRLAKGQKASSILRARAEEFRLPDASDVVSIAMKGVGVGRNPAAANTLFARKLVEFWTLVCIHAHARACRIESGVL